MAIMKGIFLAKGEEILNIDDIAESLKEDTKDSNKAEIGMLLTRRHFDPVQNKVRS